MATWRDVDRVRDANPSLTMAEIAKAIGCNPAYVRATFERRRWPRPKRKPSANVSAQLADYRGGMSLSAVARKHGVSSSSVHVAVNRWSPEMMRPAHRHAAPVPA